MYFTLFLTTIFHYIFYRDKSQLLKANGYYFKFLRLLRMVISVHIRHPSKVPINWVHQALRPDFKFPAEISHFYIISHPFKIIRNLRDAVANKNWRGNIAWNNFCVNIPAQLVEKQIIAIARKRKGIQNIMSSCLDAFCKVRNIILIGKLNVEFIETDSRRSR